MNENIPPTSNTARITASETSLRQRRRRSLGTASLAGILCAVTVTGTILLAGCGSGSSTGTSASATKATGRATMTITWPSSSSTRLVPVASNSITVAFSQNGTVVSSQTVAKPSSGTTSTVTFDSLPAGTLTVSATAYPNTDGTGTAQATTSASATITSNQVTAISLTMASTIDHLTVTPASPSLTAGSTTALTATAYDSSGAIVLTSSSKVTWGSGATGVATVDSSGVVTGVVAGTATITATDSESGKAGSVTVTVTAAATPTPTPTPTASTCSDVVCYANTYINSLSTTQQSSTVVASTVTYAEKWSNLPGPPNSDGTTSLRNGVDYGSLTTAQQTAWNNLINAALGTNGVTQMNKIRAADYTLKSQYNANGYSGDYEYVAFVGTPSYSGNWMLQVGGHHNAHNFYFTGTTLDTTTPYHLGVEPTSFTYNGTAYTPLSDQKTAMTNLLSSFSSTQLSSAKLSGSFGDLYLGAGQDARSDFPTGTSGRGILVSALSSTQQDLVKAAIDAWVKNSPLSSTYETLYYSELASTYIGYAGNSSAPGTVFTAQGDYIRIDGPHVWIEFVCQNGVVISGQIHYHTIWRDRVSDYNATTAGWTLVNHSN